MGGYEIRSKYLILNFIKLKKTTYYSGGKVVCAADQENISVMFTFGSFDNAKKK